MEAKNMNQVPVKWVDMNDVYNHAYDHKGNQTNRIPVVPLEALREVVEGLYKERCYSNTVYNGALDDLLASLGKAMKQHAKEMGHE